MRPLHRIALLALLFSAATYALPAEASAQTTYRGRRVHVYGGWRWQPRIRVHVRRPVVRVQRVYVAPPPPPPQRVIIVQQPAPQPPPTVIIQEQQPPPPPEPEYEEPVYEEPTYEEPVYEEPAPERQPAPRATPTPGPVGVHASIGGVFADEVRMGGFAGALRLRPSPHIAIDIGSGIYGGTDYHGFDRVEIPATVDLLAYVNPQHRLQFYFLVGAGTAIAFRSDPAGPDDDFSRDFTYLGGQVGAGLEWLLGSHFALNVDGRAFLRRRIDSSEPEFVDGDRQTNTSAGALGTFGATVYF